jgi:hypothetical protein
MSNKKNDNHPPLYGGMTHPLDIHYWIVNKDGSIYDPHFKSYDFIINFNQTTKKQVHEEFPLDQQKKWWAFHWKTQIKPFMQKNYDGVLDDLARDPIVGHCYINAYAYKLQNRGTRIAMGRMGWERDDGSIHWEFG